MTRHYKIEPLLSAEQTWRVGALSGALPLSCVVSIYYGVVVDSTAARVHHWGPASIGGTVESEEIKVGSVEWGQLVQIVKKHGYKNTLRAVGAADEHVYRNRAERASAVPPTEVDNG